MNTLNDAELVEVQGGLPTRESSLAYDIFYGLGAIAGSIWSYLSTPVPERWHSGALGGYG